MSRAEQPRWETVEGEVGHPDITDRLPVPGGWIYRTRGPEGVALTYVAEPAGEGKGRRRKLLAGLRIAVVDDVADTLAMVVWSLRREGAEVDGFETAEAAVERFTRVPWPDILISDIALTGNDGLWLVRQLRTRFPQPGFVPAIALSAHAQPSDVQAALAAGYNAHMAKPANPDELLAAVARLAGRKVQGD